MRTRPHSHHNGVGFDKRETAGKKRLGLLGMRERVAMMEGISEIITSPGKGTKVIVSVPLIIH
jgi:signal transduction histidine kinase